MVSCACACKRPWRRCNIVRVCNFSTVICHATNQCRVAVTVSDRGHRVNSSDKPRVIVYLCLVKDCSDTITVLYHNAVTVCIAGNSGRSTDRTCDSAAGIIAQLKADISGITLVDPCASQKFTDNTAHLGLVSVFVGHGKACVFNAKVMDISVTAGVCKDAGIETAVCHGVIFNDMTVTVKITGKRRRFRSDIGCPLIMIQVDIVF